MRRTTPPAWSIWAIRLARLASARAGVGVGRVQELLDRARQRARRRHRLIDLVRQRRGHAAHHVHARGARRLRLHVLETRLGLARGEVGALALADDDADQQARHGQHQHDDLELGERGGVVAVQAQQGNEAELGGGQAEAGAVDAVRTRGRHDRQEQQGEELVVVGAAAPTIIHSVKPITSKYSSQLGDER